MASEPYTPTTPRVGYDSERIWISGAITTRKQAADVIRCLRIMAKFIPAHEEADPAPSSPGEP